MIVENRPGASSMIATDYVARSAKDGYTLLFGTIAMTINPILMPNKAPNIEKDMTPIVLVGSIPEHPGRQSGPQRQGRERAHRACQAEAG